MHEREGEGGNGRETRGEKGRGRFCLCLGKKGDGVVHVDRVRGACQCVQC